MYQPCPWGFVQRIERHIIHHFFKVGPGTRKTDNNPTLVVPRSPSSGPVLVAPLLVVPGPLQIVPSMVPGPAFPKCLETETSVTKNEGETGRLRWRMFFWYFCPNNYVPLKLYPRPSFFTPGTYFLFLFFASWLL